VFDYIPFPTVPVDAVARFSSPRRTLDKHHCHLGQLPFFSCFQKNLHSRTGRDEKKGKTQERMERGSRKRSSSAGSEKMERVGGR